MSTTDHQGRSEAQARRTVRTEGEFDTGEPLRRAREQAIDRGLDKMLVVDVDAHHYETDSWGQIVEYLESPILRHEATSSGSSKLNARPSLLLSQPGTQDLAGRVLRYPLRHQEQIPEGAHWDDVIVRRAMDAMAIDYQIVFPTPMLGLGVHPQREVESALAWAYARWITEGLCARESRVKTMIYLPFNDPEMSLRLVETFADAPGVVGFMVTAVRYRAVHDNVYLPVYRAIEETGLPLGFHAGFSWLDRSFEQLNKFTSVHALGFPFFNMVHMTNWVMNGLPERFPQLRVIWIEGGLAWVPFLMQRLDHEYLMRTSEAPLLQRLPSEYMRAMYYTSQPLEWDPRGLRNTLEMIDAETQLMYASDYPHWDFDLPSRIYDIPYLSDAGRANILGLTAQRVFNLPEPPRPKAGYEARA
jgi:predicted TIM-barrel fold metal-dependent hydrolase